MRKAAALIFFAGLFSVAMCLRAAQNEADAAQQWEIAAGGKMAFDVASIKKDTSDKMGHSPTFSLDSGNAYPGNMTLFSAEFPLATFISFAYKLPPIELRAAESNCRSGPRTKDSTFRRAPLCRARRTRCG